MWTMIGVPLRWMWTSPPSASPNESRAVWLEVPPSGARGRGRRARRIVARDHCDARRQRSGGRLNMSRVGYHGRTRYDRIPWQRAHVT